MQHSDSTSFFLLKFDIKFFAQKMILVFILILGMQVNQVDGQVSLTFTKGYLGTQGSNTNQANLIKNLSTLGIARISFGQPTGTTFGGTQGNDLAGVIKLYLNSSLNTDITKCRNLRKANHLFIPPILTSMFTKCAVLYNSCKKTRQGKHHFDFLIFSRSASASTL